MHTPFSALAAFASACLLLSTAVAQGPYGLYGANDLTVTGVNPGESYGTSVVGLGDVNSDLVPDFAVGIPGDGTSGQNAGKVLVISGLDGTTIHTLLGADAFDAFGKSVGAADVDNNATTDILVGAPGDDTVNGIDSGAIYVFSGVDGSLIQTVNGAAAGDMAGWSVAGVGPIDAIPGDDFIYGAPGDDTANGIDSGSASVVSGLTAPTSVIRSFDGAAAFDAFGSAVASAGDFNNDVVPDFIVGAPNADPNSNPLSGQATVFSGLDGAILAQFDGDSAGDRAGTSVAGIGNVDGLGGTEVAVGAPGDDNNGYASGSVRAYSDAQVPPLWTANGAAAGDLLGVAIAAAGDVDGDTTLDVIAGAPGDAKFADRTGYAVVLDGLTGAQSFQLTRVGYGIGDLIGTAVAGIGDVNADTFPDLVVGAPGTGGIGAVNVHRSRYTMFESNSGCPDSTGDVPDLVVSGVARVGGQITIGLTGTAPGNPCLALGIQQGAPIPLSLIGAPVGCTVFVNLATSFAMPAADGTGTSIFAGGPVNLSSEPGFAGANLAFQFVVADFALVPLPATPVIVTRTIDLAVGP